MEEENQRMGSRFTLPPLTTNKGLWTSTPQLQKNKVLKLDEETVCNFGPDISQFPSAIRSTVRHINSRHSEVSQWQAQISESIRLVDWEITAVKLVKDMAESYLQEKQLYSQLISDCSIVSALNLGQDRVLNELKREKHLTTEIKELLQKQICILLKKLNSLQALRNQLMANFQDKVEAVKLMTKCINYHSSTASSRLPATQYKPQHLSYNTWLSHCEDLRLSADKLMKDSSTFRRNLRFTLANLKNLQDRQRLRTEGALKKTINELTRSQDTLIWERQRTRDTICDLTADVQKVAGQIKNCDSKMHQATHRLDILNQRPRCELCMDLPHISLTLEKHDLSKIAAGLRSVLMRSQQDLELTNRRLMAVEDKLTKTAQALEVERKRQNLHQSFLPTIDVFTNKPRLNMAANQESASALC